MFVRTRCIVLRVNRFKDSRMIVSALVRDVGRLSFIVSHGRGREGMRTRALMQPGSSFEGVVDLRPTRTLQTVTDLMPTRVLIADNPAKTALILFVCDFVNSIVQENQPDNLLFDYVDATISGILDDRRPEPNRAICFMLGLQRFMGIEPDYSSYLPGSSLDMVNGVFRLYPSAGRFLDPQSSAIAVRLSRMTPGNMHIFKFSRADRNAILDRLLDYYSIHFGSVNHLNSLPVLRSLFD